MSCEFDKEPTTAILVFESVVITGSVVIPYILSKFNKKIPLRFLVIFTGVLIFELFTAPMWDNIKLGWWAYLYQDISWVLTLGWSTMILTVVLLIDHYFGKLSVTKRFILYLITLTFLVVLTESAVVSLGIRSYSPEVKDALTGTYFIGIPIETIYYVPVFMTLVISFYKYWAYVIDNELLVPVIKGKWFRNFILAMLGVLLFELMIEPMVINQSFPSWSYIYRDITILMTLIWIIIIWLATTLIDKYFIQFNLIQKFIGYLVAVGVFALPIESWFIRNGHRVYGPSAQENFSGIVTPITNVPVEIAFAIPLYLALIVSFIRFWAITYDNHR